MDRLDIRHESTLSMQLDPWPSNLHVSTPSFAECSQWDEYRRGQIVACELQYDTPDDRPNGKPYLNHDARRRSKLRRPRSE